MFGTGDTNKPKGAETSQGIGPSNPMTAEKDNDHMMMKQMSMMPPAFMSDPFASSDGVIKPVFDPGPEGHNSPQKKRDDLAKLPTGINWGTYTHSFCFCFYISDYRAPHYISTYFLAQILVEIVAMCVLLTAYFTCRLDIISGIVTLLGMNLSAASMAISIYCKCMVDMHQNHHKLMNMNALGLGKILTTISSTFMGVLCLFMVFYTLYFATFDTSETWLNSSYGYPYIGSIVLAIAFCPFSMMFFSRAFHFTFLSKAIIEFNNYMRKKIHLHPKNSRGANNAKNNDRAVREMEEKAK